MSLWNVQDEGVPEDSLSPTYAALALHVHNPRWEGVPFIMEVRPCLPATLAGSGDNRLAALLYMYLYMLEFLRLGTRRYVPLWL